MVAALQEANLVGDRSGKLTLRRILQKRNKQGGRLVLCDCDCGTRGYECPLGAFRHRSFRSCGCSLTRSQNLIGERFGKGVVVGLKRKLDKRGQRVWRLKCDCGNPYTATTAELNANKKKSCGCAAAKQPTDLKGRTFGLLTAVERTGRKSEDGTYLWRCICKCGGEKEASAAALMKGDIKSCGCLAHNSWIPTYPAPPGFLYPRQASNILHVRESMIYQWTRKRCSYTGKTLDSQKLRVKTSNGWRRRRFVSEDGVEEIRKAMIGPYKSNGQPAAPIPPTNPSDKSNGQATAPIPVEPPPVGNGQGTKTEGQSPHLNTTDKAILRLIEQDPLKGQTIAARLDMSFDYIRQRLARLMKLHIVSNSIDGYRKS